MENDRDRQEVLNSSEIRIQRGRKSASNSGLSGSRNLQSGPSLPRDASLHGRPSNPKSSDRGSTGGHRLDALQDDYKTGSISHNTSIGRAFKSIGTRVGSGRSSSTDGGGDNRGLVRQPTNVAMKSIYPSGPTSAFKSVTTHRRGLEGNSQSLSTPSRLRFVQQKSSSHPRPSLSSVSTTIATPALPARKSGSSSFPFRKQHAPTAPPSTPLRVKISRPFLPLWQQLDEEYERNNRRIRGDDFGGFAKRISSTTNRRGAVPAANAKNGGDDPRRLKGRIAPRLKLRLVGESQSSSSEEGDRRRQKVATKLPGQRVGGPQFAVKKSAARKVEYEDATTGEDESERDTDSQEDQLLPEEYDPPDSMRRPLSPNDIEMKGDDGHFSKFNPAPRITIPLPQVKTEPEGDFITRLYPAEELLNALEALTLTSIRIQSTRRLPFLRRNLRKGFFKRCMNLHLPIYGDHKTISLGVKYEYVDGIVFHAEIEEWLCPLCNIFGKFATRAMLNRHLEWDHREVFCEWKRVEETDDHQSWKLQIMIPEEVYQGARKSLSFPADQDMEKEDGDEGDEEDQAGDEGHFGSFTVNKKDDHKAVSPPTTIFSSPFPSVSLSPPTSRQPHILLQRDTAQSDSPSGPAKSEDLSNLNPSISQQPRPYISPSIRSEICSPTLSRGRSTTGASLATLTPVRTTQRSPGDGNFPTPPPFDNPLGPAARPPYLPAHSDYGGPTVYYSCRPGGACLFDLLGTLPMKQFGVLEWEVLDREEEIYESDDMKEEYKIMHALWARWILLHRNDFISDYLQGTTSFVNNYWRMIHRASGWDGLRYWLLILLCNKFLTGHEVAQVLRHYEQLTGMASWYD